MIATRWLRIKARAGRVLLSILVAAAVAGVFWYRRLANEVEQQAPTALPNGGSKAEMVTRDFRHVETRMDRIIWVLESEQAETFEQQAHLHTVKITWYGDPGVIPVVITSAEGQVDFQSRNAVLNGRVRVERADGAVMLTEQLVWDDTNRILRAPLPVVITTPNFRFTGARLDADLATQSVKLWGRVEGEISSGSLMPAQRS